MGRGRPDPGRANLRVLVGGETIEGFRVAYTPGHAVHHVAYLHEASGLRATPATSRRPDRRRPGDRRRRRRPDIDLEAWQRRSDASPAGAGASLPDALRHVRGDVVEHLARVAARRLHAVGRAAPGIPTRREYAERYGVASASGRRAATLQAAPPDDALGRAARYWTSARRGVSYPRSGDVGHDRASRVDGPRSGHRRRVARRSSATTITTRSTASPRRCRQHDPRGDAGPGLRVRRSRPSQPGWRSSGPATHDLARGLLGAARGRRADDGSARAGVVRGALLDLERAGTTERPRERRAGAPQRRARARAPRASAICCGATTSTATRPRATSSPRRCCRWRARSPARYSGRGEPLDDLVQVACIGIMKAIDGFDLDARGPLLVLRDADRARRDQAPLPRQDVGDARAARHAGDAARRSRVRATR